MNAQSEVSEEESAQRERHLKNMRDRIISAKRAGREEQASKAASESATAAAAVATAAKKVAAAAGRGGGRAAAHPFSGGGVAAVATPRGGSHVLLKSIHLSNAGWSDTLLYREQVIWNNSVENFLQAMRLAVKCFE